MDSQRYIDKTDEQEEQHSNAADVETSGQQEISILPLRNTVVFPSTVLPLLVERPASVRLVDDALVSDRLIALVALRNPEVDRPEPSDLYEVGTLATIHRMARNEGSQALHLIVQGLERVRITEIVQTEPYIRARIEVAPERSSSLLQWSDGRPQRISPRLITDRHRDPG